MLIVSSNRNVIVNVDNVTNIYIHKDGNKIACEKMYNSPHTTLGIYDSKEKCAKAFGRLINAIERGCYSFVLPNNHDDELNTHIKSGGRFRVGQTNGKTK